KPLWLLVIFVGPARHFWCISQRRPSEDLSTKFLPTVINLLRKLVEEGQRPASSDVHRNTSSPPKASRVIHDSVSNSGLSSIASSEISSAVTKRSELVKHLGELGLMSVVYYGRVPGKFYGSCSSGLCGDVRAVDGLCQRLLTPLLLNEDSVKECDSPGGITDSSFEDGVQCALVGGDSLWESTLDQYLKNNSFPYLKFYNFVSSGQQVVSIMVNNDLVILVNTRPQKSWKETLDLLCNLRGRRRGYWTLQCDTLAARLIVAANTLATTICYICARNIDKIVEMWSKNVTSKCEGKSYVDLLRDLMEKTVVLALATGQKRFSASLCKLVEKYAKILASQGLLKTAMEYMKLMGNEYFSPKLVILRDRIALLWER
ncbi:transport protein Sec31 homolog B-like protein isoform X1, partial [Tanacetum coccineum]